MRAAALAVVVVFAAGAGAADPGAAPGLAAAVAAAPAASGQDILDAMPEELAERLLREKVVLVQEFGESGEVYGGLIRALVLFAAPLEQVQELLMQTRRQTEWRPELTRIQTVARHASGSVDRQEMKMMFVRVAYHLRNEWDPARGQLRWRLDPDYPNDFEHLEGSWELYALGPNRTLGRFGTRVNVGAGVPKFVQDYASRRTVPQTMERCRRWVDSGGEWRP